MQRRGLIGTLVAAALLLLAGRFAAAAYVDYLWFAALGASELWGIQFRNQMLLGIPSIILASLFFLANLFAVRQSVVSLVLPRRIGNLEIGEEVPGRYLTRLAVGVSLLLGLLLSFPRAKWLELAAVRHSVLFLERDPFFDRDLSYFVNWLPFERSLFTWSLTLLIAASIAVVFLYALTPSLRWQRGAGVQVTLYVRRHIGVIGALALLVLAWSFRLEMFGSMINTGVVDAVFAEPDRVMLRVRTMLTFVTILAACVLAWATWSDQTRLAFFTLTFVLLLSLGTMGLTPIIVRQSAAGELAAAADELHTAASYGRTRRAYAVDEILPAEPAAAFAFPDLAAAVNGSPAWDADKFEELAAQRVVNGRSSGSASYAESPAGQVVHAVVAAADTAAQDLFSDWFLVRALSARTTADGAPRSAAATDDVTQLHPVLVAEPAPPIIIVADPSNRIAAPGMTSIISRLAHAWSRQDFGLLFSDLPSPNPRVLVHAGVRARLSRLAPFFEQDSQIYPLVHQDTLYWVVPLYAHSGAYPFSSAVTIAGKRHQYFRYAATALLNSGSGAVRIYVPESGDPIARMWRTLAPSLFSSQSELPADIAAHLPPAIDGAFAQAVAFARVGSRSDSVQGGRAASELGNTDGMRRPPRELLHVPALAPSSAWIQPVLDSTGRVHRLLIAVGGSTPQAYRMRVQRTSASWQDIQRSLDAEQSRLSSQSSTQLSGGTVRTFLVGNDVVFARTFYHGLAAGVPKIAAVTLLSNDTMRTAVGLEQAAGVDGSANVAVALTPAQFRDAVDSLYESMNAALRRSDLAAFGDAFNALGRLLSRPPR